jgi:hypothetical protein
MGSSREPGLIGFRRPGRYVELAKQHYHNSVLNEIPEQLRALDTQTEEMNMGACHPLVSLLSVVTAQLHSVVLCTVPTPKEAAHVFIRVKEDIGDYVVDPNSAE